tara:strand:+ start:1744 stop:2394 length:651 start_codon:yes stop_codon:yes gene_type:complete
MCGRKTLFSSPEKIKKQFNINKWKEESIYRSNYNIAPTQDSLVLIYNQNNIIKKMRWGFGYEKSRRPIFNARIETLHLKPSFSSLINGHRCAILSDGYFEWRTRGNEKIPYFVYDSEKKVIPMAGLCKWDIDRTGQKQLVYTIITKQARQELHDIHHREPFMLNNKGLYSWLDNSNQIKRPTTFLDNVLENIAYKQVSQYVNSAKNNDRGCIEYIK